MANNDHYSKEEENNPFSESKSTNFDPNNFGLPEVPSSQNQYAFSSENDNTTDPYAFNDATDNSNAETQFKNEHEEDEDLEKEEVFEEEGGLNKLVVAGVLVVLVIALAVGAYLMFFSGEKPSEPVREVVKKEVVKKPVALVEEKIVVDNKKTTANVTPEPKKIEKKAETPSPKPKVAVDNSGKGKNVYHTYRRGKYFVIVSSFIDDDLAKDYAKKVSSKGHDAYLLKPVGKSKKFYRLSVGQYENMKDAENSLPALKAEFGNDIWILKY